MSLLIWDVQPTLTLCPIFRGHLSLYGRNSLSGVINIVTKKPDNQLHYGLEQTVGNKGLYESTLFLRAPLVQDKLFLGLSGTWDQLDGYNTNDYLGKEADEREGLNGRMQLRWLPTDDLGSGLIN